MSTKKVDILIIGGGTAGHKGAVRLRDAGFSVALAEPDALGGTCLNYGCIPTKAMLHAAKTFHEMKTSGKLGIIAKPTLSFKKLIDRVRSIVAQGHEYIDAHIEHKNFTLYKKKATFIDARTVRVGNDTIRADTIIIATGASNIVPAIPGLDESHYCDNKNILSLNALPKRVVCIGGGYISLEYATFFALLGSKVIVLERESTILNMLDTDMRLELLKEYEKLGVSMVTNATIINMTKTSVRYTQMHEPTKKKTIHTDCIIVATGRAPNTRELSLENAGVITDINGSIVVNNRLQTNIKHIYAVGDCLGTALFAHAAKREVNILIQNLTHNRKQSMNFDNIPWVVFTHPIVAGVGLSEKKATQQKINFAIAHNSFSKVGRAKIEDQAIGKVKILYHQNSKKIIGATIMGPQADILIHEICAIMNCKSPTIDTLRQTIHAHPTMSEVFENI